MSGPRLDALLNTRRLGKFASTGIVGAIVDLSISAVLLLTTELPPELVKLIGGECAIIVMFVINDRWTFARQSTSGIAHWVRRLVKSNLVRMGGLTVQVVVVFVLTRLSIVVMAGATDVWPLLTMPIAIGAGSVVNYIGESLLTWRVHV